MPRGDYVLTLKDEVVERRPVKTGASSVTLVQVASGLVGGRRRRAPHRDPAQTRRPRHAGDVN